MTTRHTLSHADKTFAGNVHYEGYSPDGRRGLEMPHIYVKEYGAITTLDTDGIAVAAGTATVVMATSGTITATGTLVSGGVATLDVPRVLRITSASDVSALTF